MEAPQSDPLEGFKSDIISNDTVRIKVYDDNTDDDGEDDLQDEDIEYEDVELPEPTEQNDYTKLIRQAGLRAIDQGLPVFLLQPTKRKSPYRSCDPCKTHHTTKQQKEACECLLCHGFYAATTDKDRFLDMVKAHPFGLLGYRTGGISMTFVVDIDPRNGGIESLQALEDKYGKIPDTVKNHTASAGWHLRLSVPIGETVRCQPQFAPGIDIKGDGGYAILPPSSYGVGEYREVSTGIPPAPDDWLLKLIKEKAANAFGGAQVDYQNLPKYNDLTLREQNRYNNYASSALDRIAEQLQALGPNDEWNNSVYSLCCNAVEIVNNPGNEFNLDHARQLVLENSPQDSDFTTETINQCFNSAINSVGKKCRVPKDVHIKRPWNDIGNAQRMYDRYGNVIRWATDAQKWIVYNNKRWVINEGEFVRTLVHQMLGELATTEALGYPDDDTSSTQKVSTREMFLKWVKSQQMSQRISACITELKALPKLRAVVDDFNKSFELLNCANGTINLRTGELLPHDPKHMFTQITNVEYHGLDAPAPRWTNFLERVHPDPDVRDYLQKSTGYDATGYTGEQVFHFHEGTGGNGKSQFFDAISETLGEYSLPARIETFLETKNESIPTDIAEMVGRRLIYTGEPKRHSNLNENLLKLLSGDGKAKGRYMRKDFFEFTPTGTIHFCVNELPSFSNTRSNWRRFRKVKWTVEIPENERIKDIGRIIAREEGPGVLAWIVRGSIRWFKEGLGEPKFIQLNTKETKIEMDPLKDWIDDCLNVEHSIWHATSDYYDSYHAWSIKDKTKTMLNRKDFTRELLQRSPTFQEKRKTSARGFQGPKIMDAEPDIQINYR